jgi:hypothetical protein
MPTIAECFERIPSETMTCLTLYVRHHWPVGDFLMAVLSNDLRNAIGRADEKNLPALPAIVMFLHNEVPARCWGSPERVAAWLRDGGGTCATCGQDVPAGETCPRCNRPLCLWSCCNGDESAPA